MVAVDKAKINPGSIQQHDHDAPAEKEQQAPTAPIPKISLDNNKAIFYDCDRYEHVEAVDQDGDKHPFMTGMLSILSSGTYGRVVESIDMESGIPIAIKICRGSLDDDSAWDVFVNELEFYDTIQSSGGRSWLPTFHYSGTLHDGEPWIGLELLGESLHDMNRIHQIHPHFIHYASGCLQVVESLHKEGYIHRDIKPANFALRYSDSTEDEIDADFIGQVVLLDFGFTKEWKKDQIQTNEEKENSFYGTYRYASKNQLLRKNLGPSDDLESLCYSLLEMYMGGMPQWELSEGEKKEGEKKERENKEGEKKEGEKKSIPIAEARMISNQKSLNYADMVQVAHRREHAWKQSVLHGIIPPFFHKWKHYCSSLAPHQLPDYDYLKKLIKDHPPPLPGQHHPIITFPTTTTTMSAMDIPTNITVSSYPLRKKAKLDHHYHYNINMNTYNLREE